MKLLVVNKKSGTSQIVVANQPWEVKQKTGWSKQEIVTALIPLPQSPEKEWLSRAELADWLGTHQRTILKWTKANKIPFTRVGKKDLAFNRDEILAWLQEQKNACNLVERN
jgi:excisionase family DNA binding protein